MRREDKEWTLLGIIPIFDPPREDTAWTITEAHTLGIQVKMLTRDAISIAKETCKILALGTQDFNYERLIGGGLGAIAKNLVKQVGRFAKVFPTRKQTVGSQLKVHLKQPSSLGPRGIGGSGTFTARKKRPKKI